MIDMYNLKPGDKLEYVGKNGTCFNGWDIDVTTVCTFQEYAFRSDGTPLFIVVEETPGDNFTWQIEEWAPAFEMPEEVEPEEDVDLEALIERLAARHQGES